MKRQRLSADVVSCIALASGQRNYLIPAACIEEILHKPEVHKSAEPIAESTQVNALLGTLKWQQKEIAIVDFESMLLGESLPRDMITKVMVLKPAFASYQQQPVALACFGSISQLEIDGTAVGDLVPETMRNDLVAMACQFRNEQYLILAIDSLMSELPS
ncbi:MAG: chemotaxis protein CheW [Arenicella sp.]